MWSRGYDVETPEDALEMLRLYASWPRWRRWIWRNVGR